MGKILDKVQSICPVCRKPLWAEYTEEEGKVYLIKTCQEHGTTKALIARKAEDYKNWVKAPVVNVPPKIAQTKGNFGKGDPALTGDIRDTSQCPLHCGTCGNHLQTACCVLIDVTERCNQHCPYCFASSEEDSSGDIPLEEIKKKYDLLIELGEERPFNIQLSGGEPTVRDDLPQIIEEGKKRGFEYIQINSNGRRLATEEGYAKKLKDAGATVIFMQFDGTKDDIYMKLRGEPLLEQKKKAIANCRKAGLPVTLVPTVVKDVNLDNIGDMMNFLMDNIAVVKGIHFQPVSFFGRHPAEGENGDFKERVTMFDVLHAIEDQTDGFKYEDFCPITTGHTLCCFYGTYLKEDGNKVKCLLSDSSKAEGVSCCGQETDPLEVIKKDRDYVLDKWEMAGEEDCCCCCNAPDESQVMDMDEFLKYYKQNTFTVTGMAFQDATNLDAERLKRCRVQVLSNDNRLIPFCGYNSIYRGE